MSNGNIKINLSAIRGAREVDMKGSRGIVPCIVIPIDNERGTVTNVRKAKDGAVEKSDVTLNLNYIEVKNPKYSATHFIKESVSKDVFTRMTEEQHKAMPIVGNIYPYVPKPQPTNAPESIPAPTLDDGIW